MEHQQKIYYSVSGLTIILAWMVALFIGYSKLHQISELAGGEFITFQFFKYFVNWKLYSFICLILGTRAALFRNSETVRSIVSKATISIIVLIVLSFINAVTLALIPVLFFYPVLVFVFNKSRLRLGLSIVIFTLLLSLISLYIEANGFLIIGFSELTATKLDVTNFQSIFTLLIAPNQLFGYTYGIILLSLGFWLGKTKWVIDYHFLYAELKRLFKLSIVLLVLWIGLTQFNIYEYFTNWKIGKIFFILDGLAIQLLTVYCYVFLLIYLENSRIGLQLLKLLALIGKKWYVHSVIILAYMLFQKIYNPFNFWLNLTVCIALFAATNVISKVVTDSKTNVNK